MKTKRAPEDDSSFFSAKTFSLFLLFVFITLASVFYISNQRAKTHIQHYAQQIFNMPVRIHSVNVSHVSHTAKIQGIRIANPPGFEHDVLMDIQEIRISSHSLNEEPLSINNIEIRGLNFYPERNRFGDLNLDILYDHLLDQTPINEDIKITVSLSNIRIKDIRMHPQGDYYQRLDTPVRLEDISSVSNRQDTLLLSPEQLTTALFEYMGAVLFQTLLTKQIKAGINETHQIGRDVLMNIQRLADDIDTRIWSNRIETSPN